MSAYWEFNEPINVDWQINGRIFYSSDHDSDCDSRLMLSITVSTDKNFIALKLNFLICFFHFDCQYRRSGSLPFQTIRFFITSDTLNCDFVEIEGEKTRWTNECESREFFQLLGLNVCWEIIVFKLLIGYQILQHICLLRSSFIEYNLLPNFQILPVRAFCSRMPLRLWQLRGITTEKIRLIHRPIEDGMGKCFAWNERRFSFSIECFPCYCFPLILYAWHE